MNREYKSCENCHFWSRKDAFTGVCKNIKARQCSNFGDSRLGEITSYTTGGAFSCVEFKLKSCQ